MSMRALGDTSNGLAIRSREQKRMKKDTDALRRSRVRQLFQDLPADQRTENQILNFYGWLHKNRPELLRTLHERDAYQQLKVDLTGSALVGG